MVQTFSDKEESLVWECQGVPPIFYDQSRVQIPSIKQLADAVAGSEGSHGHQWAKRVESTARASSSILRPFVQESQEHST
jgi:hypothetical protein